MFRSRNMKCGVRSRHQRNHREAFTSAYCYIHIDKQYSLSCSVNFKGETCSIPIYLPPPAHNFLIDAGNTIQSWCMVQQIEHNKIHTENLAPVQHKIFFNSTPSGIPLLIFIICRLNKPISCKHSSTLTSQRRAVKIVKSNH